MLSMSVNNHAQGVVLSHQRALRRALIGSVLFLLLAATTSCDGDDPNGTTWGGTYNVPDEFGGGSGTVSFVVQSNDTIYCFQFSGSQSIYSTPCNGLASNGFPISGNQFSIPLSVPGQGSFTLKGEFTPSSNQATGEIVRSSDAVPVLEWTATAVGEN
jgi:hypothetical protein